MRGAPTNYLRVLNSKGTYEYHAAAIWGQYFIEPFYSTSTTDRASWRLRAREPLSPHAERFHHYRSMGDRKQQVEASFHETAL